MLLTQFHMATFLFSNQIINLLEFFRLTGSNDLSIMFFLQIMPILSYYIYCTPMRWWPCFNCNETVSRERKKKNKC